MVNQQIVVRGGYKKWLIGHKKIKGCTIISLYISNLRDSVIRVFSSSEGTWTFT